MLRPLVTFALLILSAAPRADTVTLTPDDSPELMLSAPSATFDVVGMYLDNAPRPGLVGLEASLFAGDRILGMAVIEGTNSFYWYWVYPSANFRFGHPAIAGVSARTTGSRRIVMTRAAAKITFDPYGPQFVYGRGTGNAATWDGPQTPTNVTSAALAAVPEPETCALVLVGIGLIGWIRHRRKQGEACR